MTESSLGKKADVLHQQLKSAAFIEETLTAVNKLNEEALEKRYDTTALLPVVRKADDLAKTERDVNAVYNTLKQLPFESNM